MNVIHTENLTKSYGARRGVDEISVSIESGQIFGFLGPNGAGKSTMIRLLMGFLKATSGRATLFEKDCWHESHLIKQQVGYVAGDVRLYSWLTVRRGLGIVGSIRGIDVRKRGMELVERFQVEIDLPVRKMSRGNRQKVALILALAHDPNLVILDEPTSGLDPLMQDVLSDCLRDMALAGKTVFFSSHTLSEVETLCDRVAIVRNGKIVVDERLQDLKARAPRSVTMQFDSEASAAALKLPDFVQLKQRCESECTLELVGPAAELSKWSATQPITDISISPPRLDVLFRSYYEGDDGGKQ